MAQIFAALFLKTLMAFVLFTGMLHAELTLEQMKGQHAMIKPKHREKFSSIFHYAIRYNNVISNLRFFGRFFEPDGEHPVFYQNDRPDDIKIDSAHDWVSAFIQLCYPSPGLRVLGAATDPKDVVTRLELKHIGRIQEIIGAYKPESKLETMAGMLLYALRDLKDTQGKVPTKSRFEILYDKAMKNILKSYAKKTGEYAKLTNTELMRLAFQEIGNEILGSKKLKQYNYRHNPEDFIYILLLALQESYNVERYPTHIVEYLIGSLALYKARDKQELLEMYAQMHHLAEKIGYDVADREYISPQGYADNFSKDLYYNIKENMSSSNENDKKGQFDELMASPELLLFVGAGYDEYENVLPKLIIYGSTFFPHQGEKITFPDCGGTTILNLLKAFIYSNETNTFDVSKLEELARNAGLFPYSNGGSVDINHNFYSRSNPFKIDTNDEPLIAAIKYFKYYNTQNAILSPGARENWVLVLSARPGVVYRKQDVCEIDTGFSNGMKMLSVLLPGLEYQPGPNESLDKYQIHSKTLTAITDYFSSDNRKIKWKSGKLIDHVLPKEEFLDIMFNIKGNDLKLHFSQGHFELYYTSPAPDKHQYQIVPEQWKKYLQDILLNKGQFHLLNLLSFFHANNAKTHDYWLEKDRIFATSHTSQSNLIPNLIRNMAYAYADLWQVVVKGMSLMSLREFILTSSKSTADISDVFWAKKLRLMPQEDRNTQSEVIEFYGRFKKAIIPESYLDGFYKYYRQYIKDNLKKFDGLVFFKIIDSMYPWRHLNALQELGYDISERLGQGSNNKDVKFINHAANYFSSTEQIDNYYRVLIDKISVGGKQIHNLYSSADPSGKDWMRSLGYVPPAKIAGADQ